MKFFYEPIKLISTKKDIIKDINQSKNKDIISNNTMERLLDEISKIDIKMISGYADILKIYELKYLAFHLATEKNKNMVKKIICLLSCKMSQEIFDTFYLAWQNYYDYGINTQILLNFSNKGMYLKKYNFDYETFNKWVLHTYMIEIICKHIIYYCNIKKLDFNETLSNIFGIQKNTRLGLLISKYYYICCSKEEYLKVTDYELCNIITSTSLKIPFTIDEKKKFFINFLKEIPIDNILNYIELSKEAERVIGKLNSTEFNSFFEILNLDIKNKCIKWFNVRKIDDVFGDGIRGKFWKARVLEYNVQRITNKSAYDLIIMEFQNFVATEFIKERDGCIYIISNEEYNNTVLKYLSYGYSKTDFKSKMFHTYKETNYRIMHRGDKWINNVLYMIRYFNLNY